jgi:hypothetical protein
LVIIRYPAMEVQTPSRCVLSIFGVMIMLLILVVFAVLPTPLPFDRTAELHAMAVNSRSGRSAMRTRMATLFTSSSSVATRASLASSATPYPLLRARDTQVEWQRLQEAAICWGGNGVWVKRHTPNFRMPPHLSYEWVPRRCPRHYFRLSPSLFCTAFNGRPLLVVGDSISQQQFQYLNGQSLHNMNGAFGPTSEHLTVPLWRQVPVHCSGSSRADIRLVHNVLLTTSTAGSPINYTHGYDDWISVIKEMHDGVVVLNRGMWFTEDSVFLEVSIVILQVLIIGKATCA